jgi:hypothetical protein
MSATTKRPRDQRLDVFRGLTMLVIFIAHTPANPWNDWIWARFGFSSGAELFVFCSGVASALAFGSVFVKRGLVLGTARIVYRIWQVYWANIALFIAIVALIAGIDRLVPGASYLSAQFGPLLVDPGRALLGAVTLTWQPDFLDILPMYIVILALVPVMMAARRLHPLAPFGVSLGLYGLVWTVGLNLTGNPWNGAGWFLNPFAWQLVFFTGFAFGAGWLTPPPLRDRRVLIAAVLVLAAAFLVSFWGVLERVEVLRQLGDALMGPNEKSDQHPLRLLHFLALAYVVLSVVEPYRDRLDRGVGGLLVRIGQQSLATFLASLVLARIAGVLFDQFGRDVLTVTLINLAGFAALLGIAVLVAWFKRTPWASRPEPKPAVAPDDRRSIHASVNSTA